MSTLKNISPEILRDHHRLSTRQINSLFGIVVFPEVLEERIKKFEVVKEFLSVYDGLNDEKIGFIPLKGPVLSYRLYGDATVRNYNDIDILVDVRNILRTKAYLEKVGYRIGYISWPETNSLQQRLFRHINHISMSNPEKGFVIEIHWRLLRTPGISYTGFNDLVKQNLANLSFAGRSFKVLNNELELLYLIIHGGLHFWMRLKWLLDVDTFLKTQEIDWERFAKLANDLKANRMMALCKEIHSEYFTEGTGIPCNSSVPRPIVDYSKKRIIDEGENDAGSLKWVFQNFYFTLISFPGIRYKIRHINNFLFMSSYSGRTRSLMQSTLMVYRRFSNRNGNKIL
jgi:hypothetical protein